VAGMKILQNDLMEQFYNVCLDEMGKTTRNLDQFNGIVHTKVRQGASLQSTSDIFRPILFEFRSSQGVRQEYIQELWA
jgi:hypothetical protein